MRTRILRAAAEVFAERGLQGASIEDIAEAAGFSRGAFYSNFSGKADVVRQLFEARDDLQLREITNLASDASSNDAFWHALRQRRVRRGEEARQWFILSTEMWLQATRDPDLRALLAERYRNLRGSIAAALATHLPELGPTVDLQNAAAVVLALDEGLALQEHIDEDAFPEALFLETLLRLATP